MLFSPLTTEIFLLPRCIAGWRSLAATRPRRHRSHRAGVALFAWILVAAATPEALGGGFDELYDEEGIFVSIRETEGKNLPTMRGEAMIDANILEIIAVIRDAPRHPEWMHQCVEAKVVKRFNETEGIFYNRTDVPWPVADRDVVVHAKVTFDVEKKELWSRFWSVQTPLMPEVGGVVRMPQLEGSYHLVWVSERQTVLVYQVDADPGGWLPNWLARLSAERLPFDTIRNLRRNVHKTRGQYSDRIARWVAEYNLPITDEQRARMGLHPERAHGWRGQPHNTVREGPCKNNRRSREH